jgi:acetyl esterase/lipase
MKSFLATAFMFVSLIASHAEMQGPIPLWPNGAPGALGTSSNDIPTLTPFLCESNATGAALVICPGGGYGGLASHEGEGYARWLNSHGVTCFVLKYRLGSHGYRHPAMINDAARAVRWLRANAAQYQLDVHRVGIMGSSAGGHLASTLLTHFNAGDTNSTDPIERQSSRPDLGILCYAVITMGPFTHRGSHNNLIGTNATPELEKYLSSEEQVTPETPPCFLWTTFEDKTVPMENTLMFAAALRKNNVPFDLHVYQKGGHGMGLGDKKNPSTPAHPWAADCLFWLKQHDFAK